MEQQTIYTIYEHKNKINGKCYIGVTKQKPITRWANGRGYIHNKHFNDAIQKYGWDNFEHNIIMQIQDEEIAFEIEKYLIQKFDLTNPDKGYNLSEGGRQRGPSRFEKITEWAQTHKKFGEDAVQSKKVKCIETGDIFGSITEAERWSGSSKVGEVCRGKREHAGHHPETNELLTWEYANDDDVVTIKYHTSERLDKNKIKKIKCVNTGIIYENASIASKETGICVCNILRVCKGERKTAGKMKWIYIEEEEEKGEEE